MLLQDLARLFCPINGARIVTGVEQGDRLGRGHLGRVHLLRRGLHSLDVEEHPLHRFRDAFHERRFERAFHLFDESHALREIGVMARCGLRDQPPELGQVETDLLRRSQERFHVVDEPEQDARGFLPFGDEYRGAPCAHSGQALRQRPRGGRLARRYQPRQGRRHGRGILSLLEILVSGPVEVRGICQEVIGVWPRGFGGPIRSVIGRRLGGVSAKPPRHEAGPGVRGRARRGSAFDVRRNRGRDEDPHEDQDASDHRRLVDRDGNPGRISPGAGAPRGLHRVITDDAEVCGEK